MFINKMEKKYKAKILKNLLPNIPKEVHKEVKQYMKDLKTNEHAYQIMLGLSSCQPFKEIEKEPYLSMVFFQTGPVLFGYLDDKNVQKEIKNLKGSDFIRLHKSLPHDDILWRVLEMFFEKINK